RSTLLHPYRHPFPTRRSSDLKEATGKLNLQEVQIRIGSLMQLVQRAGEIAARGGTVKNHAKFIEETAKAMQQDLDQGLNDVLERSEEHTSELQSRFDLVCRLL